MRFDDDLIVGPARDGADRLVLDRAGKRTTIRLPRHGLLSCLLLLIAGAGWCVASACYVVFHDTVVAEVRQGAKASARGYEAQIAAMRDELERVRTRRMVEKAGLDERLAELGLRQSLMEKRQSRLVELSGVDVKDDGIETGARSYSAKPAPLDGIGRPADEAEDKTPLRQSSANEQADRVRASLDTTEAKQAQTLEGLVARTRDRRRTLERVYEAAGVPKPALAGDGRGRGGPFEPLPEGALTFETRLAQIEAERSILRSFEQGLDRTPIRTPAKGAPLSSGFGARLDPFLGRAAFHAGLDFDVDFGAPVKATAIGRVVTAGWTGGYGNMVEIDHGGGLHTRYGHLSAILVNVGDEVRIGSVVGRVGSTGRSTGPHLHYETRVNGEAVNPLRFLNAGRLLVAKD